MKKIIVYTGPQHAGELVQVMLGTDFDVRLVEPTPEDLLPNFHQASAFLDASMKVSISAEDIEKASNLELIVTATTGANHIDGEALESRKIPLLTLKGQKEVLNGITASAEHSWALLMSCARHLRRAYNHVSSGQWERTQFPGVMLRGKTLGVIGMGRNGSWMARYANAFGMKVLAHDPFVSDLPADVEAADLDRLLAESDITSLHVHLSDETQGMISAQRIGMMKRGSIFINTSRGELTDEAALVAALKTGQLAAVGVDVLCGEPQIEQNLLWQYAQENEAVHITPHVGGFCPDAVLHVVRFSAQRIADRLEA